MDGPPAPGEFTGDGRREVRRQRPGAYSDGSAQANLALRTHCELQDVHYIILAQRTVDTEWTLLEGTFTPPLCTLDELDIYIEGPPSGVDIFVDDVALFAID